MRPPTFGSCNAQNEPTTRAHSALPDASGYVNSGNNHTLWGTNEASVGPSAVSALTDVGSALSSGGYLGCKKLGFANEVPSSL